MKKRVLSLCLSLLLVLSLVPTAAFAADPTALEIGKEYKHTLTTSQLTQTYTFTPTEDGLYRFRLKSEGSERCYGPAILDQNEKWQDGFFTSANNLRVRHTIIHMTANQTYTVENSANAIDEATQYTLTVEKVIPLALTEGTETKYVPEKIGEDRDHIDLDPYEMFAQIPFSFTPAKSGWYTFSTKKPEIVIFATENWIEMGEDSDPSYNDSLFRGHILDATGSSVYLQSGYLYYIVMSPQAMGQGTFSVKEGDFPALSIGKKTSLVCGEDGNFATFTPDVSGDYTITPTVETDDGSCYITLYSSQGKTLKYTTGEDDMTLTYHFQKGSTYYILLYGHALWEEQESYSGTLTVTSENPLPITDAAVTVAAGPHAYTGSPIKPEVTVKLGQTTLVQDTDYTVSYVNNTSVGKAAVTVTGKGNYTGTKTAEFDITKAELALTASSYLKNTDGVLTVDLSDVLGMPSGETFTYTARDNQSPVGFTPVLSKQTLTLTANGSGTADQQESYVIDAVSDNYAVTITLTVTYTDKDVKEIQAPDVTDSVTYTGDPAVIYTGTPSVAGEETAEFTVTYQGTGDTTYDESNTAPTNAGTYTVTFALKGTGTFVANPVVRPFTITQAVPAFTAPTSDKLTAAAPLSSVTLTGGEVKGVDQTVIPGTFAWNGDTSADVVRGTAYTWIFTPTTPDGNYDFSAVTGKLTPWASSGGGNGGGSSGGSSGGTSTKPPVTEPEKPTEPVTPPPTTTTTFSDVPAGAYYADAVAWAISKGITTGTGEGQFSPAAPCTRAQVVTFLWRAAGSPAPTGTASFADVPADAYYRDAVLWAVEQGITNGTGADAFSPDATVDRAQTVTFLYRYAGSPAVSGGGFDDVASGAYYAGAVAWAVAEDITNGTSPTTFAPASNCTRAQTVTFLFRALGE